MKADGITVAFVGCGKFLLVYESNTVNFIPENNYCLAEQEIADLSCEECREYGGRCSLGPS